MGVRYEQTDVTAESQLAIPTAVVWTADNDFAQQFANPGTQELSEEADYDHVSAGLDFSMEVLDNVVVRASYSKTIARADFGQMFVANSAGTPPRATALGVTANGARGNPALVPLESTNIDVSVEVVLRRRELRLDGVLRQGCGELHRHRRVPAGDVRPA